MDCGNLSDFVLGSLIRENSMKISGSDTFSFVCEDHLSYSRNRQYKGGREREVEGVGKSTFRFEQFVFYCLSEKKICFVSVLFEIEKQKNVSKYFDIEKDFFLNC